MNFWASASDPTAWKALLTSKWLLKEVNICCTLFPFMINNDKSPINIIFSPFRSLTTLMRSNLTRFRPVLPKRPSQKISPHIFIQMAPKSRQAKRQKAKAQHTVRGRSPQNKPMLRGLCSYAKNAILSGASREESVNLIYEDFDGNPIHPQEYPVLREMLKVNTNLLELWWVTGFFPSSRAQPDWFFTCSVHPLKVCMATGSGEGGVSALRMLCMWTRHWPISSRLFCCVSVQKRLQSSLFRAHAA